MDSLYQRLKELDSDTFQRLCFQILKDKFPGLSLRHVETHPGDEGLDVFSGDLAGRPTIWQAKSFPNGVGEPQKQQIRESLKTALDHFSPSNWILCLSVDLDSKAHRWFQRWQKSHSSRVKIGLFSAGDIIHELLHRRSIRNHFFPGAAIDPIELKRLITKTAELTTLELEKLTENNLADFIERLKERDARFNYQIVFDGDLGPGRLNQAPPPGLMMSISNGSKTINIFARDVEAIRSNPPSLNVTFKRSGIEKSVAFQKTGSSQEFTSEEFAPVSTTFELLDPFIQSHGPGSKLIVGPSPQMTQRKRYVRVRFKKDELPTIEYSLMEVSPTRMGSEEAEMKCSGKGLPFEILIVFPLPFLTDQSSKEGVFKGGRITFLKHPMVGFEIRQVRKFLDALSLLTPSGEIEIIDLEQDKTLFTSIVECDSDTVAPGADRQLINDLATIADRFHLDLLLPPKLSDEDLRSISLLKTLAEGGSWPADNMSLVVTKTDQNQDNLISALAGGGTFRILHSRGIEPKPRLFGIPVDTGPCCMEAEVETVNVTATLDQIRKAPVGGEVPVNLRPLRPVQMRLLREDELRQMSSP
jgi:hypothetical protein